MKARLLLFVAFCAGTAAALTCRAADDSAAETKVRLVGGLVYAEHEDKALKLDAMIPEGDGPFPAVLIVHGGAWRAGARWQLILYANQLARSGYAVFSIDYRLAPKHKFPAQIRDCRCALRWIAENAAQYHVDAQRIGALGYSAGGHLVALLGSAPDEGLFSETCNCEGDVPRLKAVVAGGAPCEFRDVPQDSRFYEFLFGGTRRQKPDLYRAASPVAHASADDPPMLFFHGGNDHLVRLKDPEAMVNALQDCGATAELWVLDGAGHVQTFLHKDAIPHAREFFDAHLKNTAADESPS